MNLRFIGLGLYLLVCWIPASAQAPKFSNDFLNIGIGARGMAMAGASSSHTVSVQAAYWNPAGLPYNPARFQVSAQHADWYAGVGSYDYIAFGKRLDDEVKSFGSISIVRMAIDQIPNTLRLRGPDGSIDYSKIESFSVSDYGIFISYGRKWNDTRWSAGFSSKIIHRSFGSFAKAWGFGVDAAIRFQSNDFSASITGRDITTTFNSYRFNFNVEEQAILSQTGNVIPSSSVEYTLPKVILAASKKFRFSETSYLLTAFDLECSTYGTQASILGLNRFILDPKMGIEGAYLGKVFLRFGVGNFQRLRDEFDRSKRNLTFSPSAGMGLKLGKLTLDYAMTNIGNTGAGYYSHFISLLLDL